MEFIFCACGCGGRRLKYDRRGIRRKYICGHNKNGIRLSKKTRKKMSRSNAYFWKDKKRSKEARRKMSVSRLKYIASGKDGRIYTKIEKRMAKELRRRRIEYRHQYRVKNMVPDFRIAGTNILIECDGDYWHGSLEAKIHDRVRDERLKELGYKVLRFWEHEINDDIEKCVNRVRHIMEKANAA